MTNGIFIYNSIICNIYENTITDNGACGIYCTSNGVPYLWNNAITDNNQAGVYCIINSPALFGDYDRNPGYNLITQNTNGVTCGLESHATIGKSSAARYNSIHDNTGYEVSVGYDSHVMAEYVWWNRYPPAYPNFYCPADFYTFTGGTIDYVPAMQYDPLGGMVKAVSTGVAESGLNQQANTGSSSFLDSELSEALDNLLDGKYEDAITKYIRRLQKEPDRSKQKYILSRIAECYQLSGKDGFIDFLNNVVRKKLSKKNEVYAKTLELENYILIRECKYHKAVDNYLTMINEFTDNEALHKNALFNLGYLHFVALDDRTQGKTYFKEFIEKYPDDDLNLIVYETMGEPEKWKLIKKSAPPIADEADIAVLPSEYRLLNNYPNPFNPTTRIHYSLPQNTYITLRIYNLRGQIVATLVDADQPAGNHVIHFDGSDLSTGVYFCRMTTKIFTKTVKLMLLK